MKKLEFSQLYEFGKGQSAFISFRRKNKVHQKYQNFIRGGPYKLSQTPLDPKQK